MPGEDIADRRLVQTCIATHLGWRAGLLRTSRLHPRLEQVRVFTTIGTLRGNRVIGETIQNGDAINASRINHHKLDISTEEVDLLGIGQNELNRVTIKLLETLPQGPARLLKGLEQLLV